MIKREFDLFVARSFIRTISFGLLILLLSPHSLLASEDHVGRGETRILPHFYSVQLDRIQLDPKIPWREQVISVQLRVDTHHRELHLNFTLGEEGHRFSLVSPVVSEHVIKLPIFAESIDFCELLIAEAGDAKLSKLGSYVGEVEGTGEYMMLEDYMGYQCYRPDPSFKTHLLYLQSYATTEGVKIYKSEFWGGPLLPEVEVDQPNPN